MSIVNSGRNIGIFVTLFMQFIDSNVWLATCPNDSPVAIARQPSFLATSSAMRSINLLVEVIVQFDGMRFTISVCNFIKLTTCNFIFPTTSLSLIVRSKIFCNASADVNGGD